MKKILFAIAIVMMMGLGANAQRDAFFNWNDADNDIYRGISSGSEDPFALPQYHGYDSDPAAPLGSGLLVLTALGAGYAVARKRRSKEKKLSEM